MTEREPARATDPAETARSSARPMASFEDLLALAGEKRDLTMKAALERDVRLVRFEDGQLEIALEPNAPKTLVNELSGKLADWTGRRWMVIVSAEEGQPTLRSRNEARRAAVEQDIKSDPLVQAVMARFPGSQIVNVRAPMTEPGSGAIAPPVENDDGAILSDDVGAVDFNDDGRDPQSERD